MKKTSVFLAMAGFLFLGSCSKQEIESDFAAKPQLNGDPAALIHGGEFAGPENASSKAVVIYKAQLSGDQEVPPVETEGKGQVVFRLQGNSLHFRLIVNKLTDVTMAHIHAAQAGQNGPAIVTLFAVPAEDLPGLDGVSSNGILAQGDLSLNPEELSGLIDLFESGGAYVNVHTKEFPAGEVRGQVAP